MRFPVFAFAVACCLAFASTVQAADLDITKGEVLLRYTKLIKISEDNGGKPPEAFENFMLCVSGNSFITGYIQGCQACQDNYQVELPYLLPRNASSQQLALVIEKYLNAHPEKLNLISAALVTFAFMDAFPNPKFTPQAKK